LILEILIDARRSDLVELLVVCAVDIVCDNADIAILNEKMVCLISVARIIPKFSYHHIELFALFYDWV
jgi:hypothetical protein